ncbi:MAG: response regulator [Alphaproteobacteria bacterium]
MSVQKAASANFGLERKTILIIDDEPVNGHLINELLPQHEVLWVENGTEGIEMAINERPDLILLDINMPDMLGFEVCRRLRAAPVTQDTPIIFITTMDAIEDKIRGFEVGGMDYIVKPYSKEEVVARVNTHLLLRSLRSDLEDRNQKLTHFKGVLERLVLMMTEANGRVYENLRAASASLGASEELDKAKETVHGMIVTLETELRSYLLSDDGT